MRTGLTSSIVAKLKAFVRARKVEKNLLKQELHQVKQEAQKWRWRAEDLEQRLRAFVNVKTHAFNPMTRRRAIEIETHDAIFATVPRELIYREASYQLVEELRREVEGVKQ